jgi:hypothetical protein
VTPRCAPVQAERVPRPRPRWAALRAVLLLACVLGAMSCQRREREPSGPVTLTFWQFWRTEWIRPLLDQCPLLGGWNPSPSGDAFRRLAVR